MIDLTMLRQALAMSSGDLWAMRSEGAMALATAQDRRQECAVRTGERLADGSFARVQNGVAIVPVRGALMNRFHWAYFSYEEIERDIRTALGDDRVNSILLDVESPGGMAAGCDECAAFIRAASEQKPVEAHIEGIGASAAFWLATAATSITASPTAMIGSVGVIIRYMDFLGIFERLGATRVEIMATQSPNKSHPAGSAEERAELQPIVDELADMFIAAVSDFRDVTEDTVRNDFGGGAIMSASVALSVGMIDQIGNFDTALAALADRQNQPEGPGAAAGRAIQQENEMDWKDVDAAGLSANRPELVEGIAKAAADAATTAERERISGLQENCLPGYETQLAKAIEDGTTPDAFAAQIVQEEKKKGAAHLNQRAEAENDGAPKDIPTSEAPASATNAKPTSKEEAEDAAKAEWGKLSASDREQFVSESSFVALRVSEMGFGSFAVRNKNQAA